MKDLAKNNPELERNRELETTCRLWIAVSGAKDERIRELELECQALRQRVARLSRQVGRRERATGERQVRFAR